MKAKVGKTYYEMVEEDNCVNFLPVSLKEIKFLGQKDGMSKLILKARQIANENANTDVFTVYDLIDELSKYKIDQENKFISSM